ncbi:hypothetical protein SLNWT_5409 [Streptomyces albus]|uniref:Lipoprotein n=1 Tax=Streptomyces albus (strain ATCC 21838 / DSM 41398 / FERM P-419 / JCM 4703 / NBRC 107858) TaxID=1081613 RepID=A0A0B5F2I0_STRA4|nr:hypothetical protein SLNWT_5409 [Streptomyces albus]AYN35806.1 hypothetical protein DUI70_5310 [Streptomyces albus]
MREVRRTARRGVPAGTVAVAAAVGLSLVLTGCGGSGKSKSRSHKGSSSHKHDDHDSGGNASGGAGSGSGSSSAKVERQITLEVFGSGRSQVAYTLDTNRAEQATLPWKKTGTLSLTKAEQQVGRSIGIVPGSVQREDGKLEAAACRITVDGKVVVDKKAGVAKPCQYEVK